MLSKILTPAQDELLKDERRLLSRLQDDADQIRRRARASAGARPLDRAARRAVPARHRRRVQRRQERVHQCAARQPGGRRRGHADHRADQRAPVRRHHRAAGARVQPARHHRAGPARSAKSTSSTRQAPTPSSASTRRSPSEFVPRSDLVLFVTSADRPFTETERAFLEQVRGWGKKVVIVINKIDILESARERRGGPHASSPRTRARCSASAPRSFR